MLLRGQTTKIHMYECLPFCPLHHTALVLVFRSFAIVLQATPFVDETRKIHYHSLGRTESCWGGRLEEILRTSCKLEHVTCVLGGRPLSNMVLLGNAKQTTSEGESAPVETGLTGSVATALH